MPQLIQAIPVLASLNMDETVTFYREKMGFSCSWHDAGYAIVYRDAITLHFWKCDDPIHPENTSCYVDIRQVDELYVELQQAGVIHPNGALEDKPWGMREFAVLDIHGNMIKFGEALTAVSGYKEE